MNKQSNLLKLSFFALLALAMTFTGCSEDEAGNVAPVISSVQVNPATVSGGGSASITVVASDADGDPLTYSYVVSGGAVNGSGASAAWTAPTTAGAYSVTVTVTDGKGGEASSNGSLNVSAPVTQISGTASVPAGSSFDLSNAKVSIYLDESHWFNIDPHATTTVVGSGASVTFNIPNLDPQTYFLEVWKDLDQNGVWSTGDLVGHHGTGSSGTFTNLDPIVLSAGETENVSISMSLY